MECPNCHNLKKKCYVDGDGKGLHCFHCGYGKTWRAFQRMFEPPTPEEQAREDFLKRTVSELWNNHPDILQWLRDRGFSDATVKAINLGYCDASNLPAATADDISAKLADAHGRWFLNGRIVIPYMRDGYPITFRGRTDPQVNDKIKYFTLPGDSARPYYPSEVDKRHPVILTEGELDAALLRQEGIQAIGIPGANVGFHDEFAGFQQLYIAYDADSAGAVGCEKLIKSVTEIRRIDLPNKYDVTEYIRNFGLVSFKALIDRAVFYLYGKPQKEDKFTVIIDEFQDWAFTNGELRGPKMGKWAPRFEEMLSGWQPGLVLIGAEAHSGKTCFMVKAGYEAALENPDDTVVVFLSLDDTKEEFMLRLASLHTQIDFNFIASPRIYVYPDPVLKQQYEDGMESLRDIQNIIVRDATYGRSLRYLRNYFESLRTKYPDKRLIVMVDSLAKITADGGEEDATEEGGGTKTNWKAYLASELKYLTTKHRICLVTPTDLRKLNGARRPTRDDLKDAAELAYEAQVILLMYNDLKRMRDDSVLKWHPVDSLGNSSPQPEPILEVINDKNKFTGRTGVIRYNMIGAISDFFEASYQEDQDMNVLVQSQLAAQSKRGAA